MDKKNNVYTDLALEAHNLAVERTGRGEVQGVSLREESTDNAQITRVEVLNRQGAEALGKPIGKYVTIESDGLQGQNRMVHDDLAGSLGFELEKMINFEEFKPVGEEPVILVVGLGNWNATPDALGPNILDYLMVTRHLYDQSPPEVRQGMRSVCALAPGVLGLTGIQTAEIIKGVVEMVKPDMILAIDALAARSTDRLGKTIQLSNTGIYPGSGIGKNRMALNHETMNIPVFAAGVPTVVDAGTIVNDSLGELMQSNLFSSPARERFRNTGEQQVRSTIDNVLNHRMGRLIVSPKGIDELIKDVSRIIAGGINIALHPEITSENLSLYL